VRDGEIVGYIAGMGEKRKACRVWGENQKERVHQEDLNVGGSIILK
jgi:hypothetical protein